MLTRCSFPSLTSPWTFCCGCVPSASHTSATTVVIPSLVVLLPHIACDTVGVALVAVVPMVSTMGILARNVTSTVLLPWFFVFCVAHRDFARSPILRLSLPWTLCHARSLSSRFFLHCMRYHGLTSMVFLCRDSLPSQRYHGVSGVVLHRGSSTRRAQPYYGPSAIVVRLTKLQHLLLYGMAVSVIIGLILPLQLLDVSSNCNVLMLLRHGRQRHDRGLLGP